MEPCHTGGPSLRYHRCEKCGDSVFWAYDSATNLCFALDRFPVQYGQWSVLAITDDHVQFVAPWLDDREPSDDRYNIHRCHTFEEETHERQERQWKRRRR